MDAEYRCTCGEVVRPRASVDGDDWTWHGGDGRMLVPYEPIPWEWLKAHDIATYSRLACAEAIGHLGMFHVHRPVERACSPTKAPPACCGEPMRLSPRGWVCRARCSQIPVISSSQRVP